MTRIFAAGDLHSDRLRAKLLAKQAVEQKADLILLNGDIVEEDDSEGIVNYFVKTGKPVFLIPGNHDWIATEFLAQKYKVVNLHGKSIMHNSLGIFACGGSNMGQLTENEIYQTIKEAHSKLTFPLKKILVSHVHPAGTKMETFSKFVKGSTGLRKAIEATKPDLVICGHAHEAEGIEEKIGNSLVINVGKKGKLIEL